MPLPTSYRQAPAERRDPVSLEKWWKAFQKPGLERLVEEVLQNNLDLRLATVRVLEIYAQFVQSRADRLPVLTGQGSAERSRQPQSNFREIVTPGYETNRFGLTFPASYELDLWGRLARAEEAARADLLQAEENRRTVAQTVVSEAITLFLVMESLERRIQVTLESIKSYRRNLKVVEGRYQRGLVPILDVRQARRILAQAEALLPALRQELSVSQQALSILAGRYPETRQPSIPSDAYYHPPPEVPPGLPSELLLRRPDIRTAEARLRALNARVGVARASRFPRISLTAGFGYSSWELSTLFTPESELWNLAAGLTQPLFDGGRLKAQERGAEARYQQGLIEYARTVLRAFAEVEEALLIRREQVERREKLVSFLGEARATLRIAETRYERGLEGYLNVLEAQQSLFQAEQNVIQAELNILSNQVSLHRALGGGWADPGPVDLNRTEWVDYLPWY